MGPDHVGRVLSTFSAGTRFGLYYTHPFQIQIVAVRTGKRVLTSQCVGSVIPETIFLKATSDIPRYFEWRPPQVMLPLQLLQGDHVGF